MAITPFDELIEAYAPSASQGYALIAAASALREEARFDIDLVVHFDTSAQAVVDVANEALASYALGLYAASEEELTATLRPAGAECPLPTIRPDDDMDHAPACRACAAPLCSDRDRPGISDAPRLEPRIGTREPGAMITAGR